MDSVAYKRSIHVWSMHGPLTPPPPLHLARLWICWQARRLVILDLAAGLLTGGLALQIYPGRRKYLHNIITYVTKYNLLAKHSLKT